MTSCSQCLVSTRFDYVKKGEFLLASTHTHHTKASYSICNASMDGRDIVAIMPTGMRALSGTYLSHNEATQVVGNL